MDGWIETYSSGVCMRGIEVYVCSCARATDAGACTCDVGCGRDWQSSGAGLPPQECGLSQISVPPPSPPLCHSKRLIVGDTKRERLQTVCCEKQEARRRHFPSRPAGTD
ncbi:hypothetical protein INR49_023623 [Caranx melampygus]|nr:hypothetical protein INR49_023623 [Caranx melampygus]